MPHWHSVVFSPEHWDPAAALPVTEMIQIMQIADGGNTHHSPSSGMAVHSALNPGKLKSQSDWNSTSTLQLMMGSGREVPQYLCPDIST